MTQRYEQSGTVSGSNRVVRGTGRVQGGSSPQARRPVPRPASGHGRRRGLSRDIVALSVGGVVVIVLALLLQMAWPDGFPLIPAAHEEAEAVVEWVSEIHTAGPVRINELMTSNRHCYLEADGSSPDWIELANVSDEEVDLKGYSLAKSASDANVFTFPSLKLAPGECVLVLADSRLREDAGQTLHAPFRLSSLGDTLMLFNEVGTAIDTVNIPELASDISYARMDTEIWQPNDRPTPGQLNTEEGYQAMSAVAADSDVIITELMANNQYTLADAEGVYYDYVELYNRSSDVVNLEGWFLSDDASNPRKWMFPEVSIEPGECLLVYASGLNTLDGNHQLHTNFGLSSEGEQLVLADPRGKIMDRVDFGLLKADVAWSRSADGNWAGTASPSPGRPNY